MQIQQLRYLLVTAKCTSFRAAAKRLFVSQSALSAAIKDLEKETAATIFKRNSKGIYLTDEGAETSGFCGNTYFGHEEVVGSIIDQLLDGAKYQVERGLVNVFAFVPNIDAFWRNDLENLKALPEKLGLADFLVHDMGFSLEHMSLTCNSAGESEELVLRALDNLGPDIRKVTKLLIDGYEIREAMEPALKATNNALILGSTWETRIAKEYDATLLHVSLPTNDDAIVTRGYFGYDGGLRLAEDIYAGVFRKGNITYMTQSN